MSLDTMAFRAAAATLRYLGKGLRLIPFLRPRNPQAPAPAQPTWLDILGGIDVGPVKIHGLTAVLLAASVGWVIIRNPELFFSSIFGAARGGIKAIDSGSILLHFTENTEADILKADAKAASDYLSLALGYEIVVYFQPFDPLKPGMVSPSRTLVTLPYEPGIQITMPREKQLEALEDTYLAPNAMLRALDLEISDSRRLSGVGWIFAPIMIVNAITYIIRNNGLPMSEWESRDVIRSWFENVLEVVHPIRETFEVDSFFERLGITSEFKDLFHADPGYPMLVTNMDVSDRTMLFIEKILALHAPAIPSATNVTTHIKRQYNVDKSTTRSVSSSIVPASDVARKDIEPLIDQVLALVPGATRGEVLDALREYHFERDSVGKAVAFLKLKYGSDSEISIDEL